MKEEMKNLINKFAYETKMDDVEIEEFNERYYVCNDVRQLGEIHEIDNEYCICLDNDDFQSRRFNFDGWI